MEFQILYTCIFGTTNNKSMNVQSAKNRCIQNQSRFSCSKHLDILHKFRGDGLANKTQVTLTSFKCCTRINQIQTPPKFELSQDIAKTSKILKRSTFRIPLTPPNSVTFQAIKMLERNTGCDIRECSTKKACITKRTLIFSIFL